MSDTVDVTIVGAGPYGLSLGAHLAAAGVGFRQFGLPMRLWQESMPRGMYLKSQGFASDLSSPDREHTLAAFCTATGRPYASYGLPVPLDTFVAYGQWFRRGLLPDLEQTLVTEVVPKDGHYEIGLASGDRVRQTTSSSPPASSTSNYARAAGGAARVGLHPQLSAHRPGRLPRQEGDRGRAGQSALESAALLHENGAYVQLVARTPKLAWNGAPLPPDRPFIRRLREPEAGLGSGWSTWFYSRHPELFRHLPQRTRVYRARTALGQAGACWLPSRVNEGQFPLLLGQAIKSANADGDGVVLDLKGLSGARREIAADHLIAATGYHSDLRRLAFLSDQLRPGLRTLADSPVVDGRYQSSVPGLYFIGPAVAPTFGPVMRFVYGSDHAARTVARQLSGTASRRSGAAAGTGR